MLYFVERERLKHPQMSLRKLATLLRGRGHRLTKDGLQQRAQGHVPYTMQELVDIAQLFGIPLERLYEVEPHEQACSCRHTTA